MSFELNLRFPDPKHVIVALDLQSAGPLDFAARITAKDRDEIRWYLETYAAHYTTEVDDAEARRIEAKLPEWGTALFDATFHDQSAQRLFKLFRTGTDRDRQLTISAEHPAILSLPWELLRDPKGIYLFKQKPRISIRRRPARTIGQPAFLRKSKPHLRLLFVTCRPSDTGFLDPRSDPQAIMNAVEQHAPGRIAIEFLRPATFRNLTIRLEDKSLPTVDVIHFDGHGAFDSKGNFGDGVPNTGYLLFERESGLTQFVSADFWHEKIEDNEVPLVILSACQSAAISNREGDEAGEPIGSVAYGLAALGVPAVLAMTHSLLVETAGQLFGDFYRCLAEGKGVGAALDNARLHLMQNPEKHEVQRGIKRVRLMVTDWFLPALYQAGQDMPLLDDNTGITLAGSADFASEVLRSVPAEEDTGLSSELPALQEAGFFGRQRELWDIERWFVAGTRRINITGFGGQGKTFLGAEAGRWLKRTGMFKRVAFVDYSAFQGVDARGYALATLGSALGKSLIDFNEAVLVLKQTPTLVILDNMEDLGQASMAELLSAAKTWSECDGSRVVLTSRTVDFNHADYPVAGSLEYRCLMLSGLDEEAALSYFQSLMRLPPAPSLPALGRDALLKLFQMVSYHPLSIRLLALQLKTRSVRELGPRLESLLAEDGHDNNKSLSASLQLSLDKLDSDARHWLPRLGVFQGGALEDVLIAVTKIPKVQWNLLREQLQEAALIEIESLEGMPGPNPIIELPMPSPLDCVTVPYLKFHPTLAPLLWSQLLPSERNEMAAEHCDCYYQLSFYLNIEDERHPQQARKIARRELPNLLQAVNVALEAGHQWTETFIESVNLFLRGFGLNRESAALAERAAALPGE